MHMHMRMRTSHAAWHTHAVHAHVQASSSRRRSRGRPVVQGPGETGPRPRGWVPSASVTEVLPDWGP